MNHPLRRSLILVVRRMKALYYSSLLLLLSLPAQANESETVLVKYLNGRLSSYAVPEVCSPAVEGSEKIVCNYFSGYYVFDVKPMSAAKAPRKIRVAYSGHSPALRRSNNLWLLELKKIDKAYARKIGAEYLIVSYAELNNKEYCRSQSVSLNNWLFLPVAYPTETAMADSFCYSLP